MKFKVGDKVRLKKYIRSSKLKKECWIPNYIVEIMRKSEMTIVTVDVSRIPLEVEFYNPHIDSNDLWWLKPEYLEPTKEMIFCEFLESVGSNE